MPAKGDRPAGLFPLRDRSSRWTKGSPTGRVPVQSAVTAAASSPAAPGCARAPAALLSRASQNHSIEAAVGNLVGAKGEGPARGVLLMPPGGVVGYAVRPARLGAASGRPIRSSCLRYQHHRRRRGDPGDGTAHQDHLPAGRPGAPGPCGQGGAAGRHAGAGIAGGPDHRNTAAGSPPGMIEERLAAVIADELTGSGRSQTAVNESPSRSTSTCTSPPGNLDDPLPHRPVGGGRDPARDQPRSPWPDEDTGGVQLPLSGTLPVPLTDPGCALPSAPLTRNPGFMIQSLRAALAPVDAECPRHRTKGPARGPPAAMLCR